MMQKSLQAIKDAVNRIMVSGRNDCYAIVAINNELDKLIEQEQEKELSEHG